MEISGLTPIIYHFNSNAYVGNVEMIRDISTGMKHATVKKYFKKPRNKNLCVWSQYVKLYK